MSDLLASLREAPHRFNLFQAISLIERSLPGQAPVGTSLGLDEAVRLAAQVDMAFAASDIASLGKSTRPGPALTLRTAALTLAGGQGPLAAPFTELLLEQRGRRGRAGLDFLDIFNQRLLGFWQRARSKHHLALQPPSATPAPLLRTIDALSGLGRTEGACDPAGDMAWLRHAGLQGAAPRSMASLLALLRDRLGIAFHGQQFAGAWHALAPTERARLQSRAGAARGRHLGASLGARAWDQGAGLALSAPALSPSQFAALLPGGAQFALMAWLVKRHLQADFTVTLTLALNQPPATRLRGDAVRLGRNAWLCSRAGTAARYRHARFILCAPHVSIINGT